MKNFKSSESRDGGRDRRDDRSSFGKRDNFRNDNFSKGGFGGKSFGSRGGDFKKSSNNRGSAFGSDRGEVVMSKATCSECSNVCEVPFKPNGERPVFCSNCFMSKREGTFEKKDERKGNLRENDRRERRDSYSTPTINTSNSSAEVTDLKKQISNLNTKIDSLANVVDKFMVSQASAVNTKKEVTSPVIKTEAKSAPVVKKEVAKKVVTEKVLAKKEVIKKVVAAKKEVIKAIVVKKVAAKAATKEVAKKVTKVATPKVVAKKEVAKKVVSKKK